MALKRYRYTEVKKMTQSFKDKLGQGGYGGVFKGKLPDGHDVAVKVLKESNSNGEEFVNEVASISRTSHVNIVTLLGFCYEGSKRALIYEFMSNGSLENYGMLVLEMAGARNNICVEVDSTSEIYFPDWIYKRLEIDEELGLCGIDNEEENQIARKLILVSLWCIQTNPKNRPPMDRVVKMLQGSVASLSIPPRPSWHSPSRSPPELVADSSTTIEFNNVVLTSN
ncbi:receptor serine/threonine kinase, putative [Ricinus communis]|uniref:Receptor serine/threonine kinase, putative n=1 Tax=Ricinus communis TaxID=3988 RepID=B9SFY2_RICCO|nr:receptor serine/threonine kinase, putative [Ricinus communis]